MRLKHLGKILLLITGVAAFACPSIARAQSQPSRPAAVMRTEPRNKALLLGAAWYPEQWPESRWDSDLLLMERAHFSVVRVGEFAWSTLEPSEGHFTLDWLDRAIELAAKHHLAVVVGTPTDAPPAWLTSTYPDTLGTNADGHTREHGGRRQFNYASPQYREFCRKVVAAMAQRFGHNPAVIGWQIGNEYTDESFDLATRVQFQQFLRAKYGTLENLNQRWATAYWSQTYSDWSQIPLEAARGNPGLLLEHKHFVTATWRSFQREQIDTLRPLINKAQFITTNIGGLAWSDNWDHYAIAADLDLASWDDYVGTGHLNVTKNAMLNDFVRGWRRKNFWVMETQPGSVNWAPVNNTLDRGEARALAWQAIGHGADAVLYWQWRAALNGQEQYHGAIVGADGTALPLYDEVSQLGEEFVQARFALAGTSPQAEVALLHTYDSRWAIDFQQHSTLYDQQDILQQFYAPLSGLSQASGHQVDIIDPTQAGDLAHYRFLVAPSLNVISQDLAAGLLAYVRNGGHLLLGPRSGMKDQFNALNLQRQPGPLASALGARVEQFYALKEAVTLEGASGSTASIWAEPLSITSPETRIDLRFAPGSLGWLDHRAAMVTRAVGRGTLSYLGTVPAAPSLAAVLHQAALEAGVSAPQFQLPPGVELCVRQGTEERPSRRVAILINHSSTPVSVKLAGSFTSVLPVRGSSFVPGLRTAPQRNPSSHMTTLELDAQGVAVLLAAPEGEHP